MLAKINDREWCYTIHGQGQPLLPLADGPGMGPTYFRPWLDGLGEQVQLIYCDFEGNAPATRPRSWRFNPAHRLAEIDALRAYLGYEQIILFGHAYGGWLAQEYALWYSDRLAGLILCEVSPSLAEADLNRLDEIFAPTLIVAGRHNQVTPPLQAERLHALLPNSTLVIFDRSGCFPFQAERDKFMTVVNTWLASLKLTSSQPPPIVLDSSAISKNSGAGVKLP